MEEELLTIREAAQFLGVSIDTLRRWDKSGKLVALKKAGGTHRHYSKRDLEIFSSDLSKMANDWAVFGGEIPQDFYCSNSAIFQTRLTKMQDMLMNYEKTNKIFSIIVAVAGEIGNNSYDHNLGNWPDAPGIFFGYDIHKGIIVLADRGLGVLKTLSRIKPELINHEDALRTAFTEIISGRSPEERGNGLKFVREVISKNPVDLLFRSGDAELNLKGDSEDLNITKSKMAIRGCLAIIKF
ncbi:MAG: helix-turn-helix domain-containing protein [Candidatus Nealsonbacteria bacterium]